MKTHTTIPTDKHGRIYYGPKTCAQADEQMQQIRSDGAPGARADERKLLHMLRDAGFGQVANRTKKKWNIAE